MKSRLTHTNITAMVVLFVLNPATLIPKAHSATIESRSDLVFQLGPSATTEDFESYKFPANSAQRVGTSLDATSVIDGQGPGLVRQGIRFLQSNPAPEGLQWDRQFQYGLTSAALVTDGRLIIDFIAPVSHVGFDMFWFDVGFSLAYPATVQVFAADDVTLLYSTTIFEPYAPNSFFFGFTDSRGIGRIVLFRDEGGLAGVSPMIDNLTFGYVPHLTITLNAQQITLSWPQIAPSFQLETTSDITKTASWAIVPITPVTSNGENTVTLPVMETRKFFRLRGQ